ncbi:MAG: glycosyltransferase family 2 protein [Rhodospirillales bacterium]|nr:MAG: glycosyltransferase family 2 protein [Rhodospirillales bacterium]
MNDDSVGAGTRKVLLSALVVAHNEEAQLADCLATLGFADEIVVVLDRCTDGSRASAVRFTDRLIEGAWEREGGRRNTGIEACRGTWIVEVDADERIPAALAGEIRAIAETSAWDWHLIPVDNFIGGRLVRYGWGGSFGRASVPALFRRGAKVWGDERVHPRLTWQGRQGPRLTHPLLHYVDRDISDMLRRLDRYTTLRARDLRERGGAGTLAGNLRRLISRFYKCYVRRRGYREGGWGVLLALCAGLYPLLSYLKATLEDDHGRPIDPTTAGGS